MAVWGNFLIDDGQRCRDGTVVLQKDAEKIKSEAQAKRLIFKENVNNKETYLKEQLKLLAHLIGNKLFGEYKIHSRQ